MKFKTTLMNATNKKTGAEARPVLVENFNPGPRWEAPIEFHPNLPIHWRPEIRRRILIENLERCCDAPRLMAPEIPFISSL
jgi:hypothetical protein